MIFIQGFFYWSNLYRHGINISMFIYRISMFITKTQCLNTSEGTLAFLIQTKQQT